MPSCAPCGDSFSSRARRSSTPTFVTRSSCSASTATKERWGSCSTAARTWPSADAVPPLAALVGQASWSTSVARSSPEAVVVLADFAEPGGRRRLVLGSVGFLPGELDEAAALGDLHACGSSPATPAGGRVSSRPSSRRDPGSSFRPGLGRLHRATRRPVARRAPPRRRKIRASRLAPGRSTRQLTARSTRNVNNSFGLALWE